MALNSIVTINEKKIGNGYCPYIISEMACAHNGDFEQAKKLIEASKKAGADAVQLQFFIPESTVTPYHETFSILKKIAFSKEQWKEIFNYGKHQGLDVWVCTYDMPSIEWAKEFKADGIKLNSADLSNPEIISSVAQSGIPFTLGTGASSVDEVNNGLSLAKKNGASDIILMHGVQNFPTQIESLNIARVRFLKENFSDLPVGYADHTNAEDEFSKIVDLIAIGLEANLIEKHITLERSMKGIDCQSALEPDEYRDFVDRIKLGYRAFGTDKEQAFTESELKYRKFQKKSIVANKNLKKGHVLKREDIDFLRNKVPGMPPIELSHLVNKKLIRDINQFENILILDIE